MVPFIWDFQKRQIYKDKKTDQWLPGAGVGSKKLTVNACQRTFHGGGNVLELDCNDICIML